MKTVGFPISKKDNENRRALLIKDLKSIKNIDRLFFEKGYLKIFGIDDDEILNTGANVVDRAEILKKDIICDCKVGDADYLNSLIQGQTIFGWIHAVKNKPLTNKLIEKKLTAIEWADMFENNKHVFYKNNFLAGEVGVLDGYNKYGKMPNETNVAILGKGNTALGAYNCLIKLGAKVDIYDRKGEDDFRLNLSKYDVVINAVCWDIKRKDHIIYKSDLKSMKKSSTIIIDISCDECGAIETSVPTSISNPIYYVDGVMHYVVDNIPSIMYKTASKYISEDISKYIDFIIEDSQNAVLDKATCIKNGKVLDEKIIIFQNR